MNVAILLFDHLTALDAVGPYEVLSRIPGATIHWVAKSPGQYRSAVGNFAMIANRKLDELTNPDIVVVPGGLGARSAIRDPVLLNWIKGAHAESRWTTSVCTGALILGAAGILNGLNATTHWTQLDELREFGAQPTADRIVREGKVITAAGVSAGIDMALELARLVAGETVAQAIQLSIEYDPQPPFQTGSPAKAPQELVDLVRQGVRRAESKEAV